CVALGYGDALGTELFSVIEPFADYAFNKSHAYGYGLIAYQNAWLKVHYPVEYFCGLLTSVKDDKDKTAMYLSACKEMGIVVLVPDVNKSRADFTPVAGDGGQDGRILFGLAAIRNVGSTLVDRIVAERDAGSEFKSFEDFCRRMDPSVLSQRTLPSLIYAGAFDS
ncbi:DNA polymerase III subunit alpha, partial [mine drainage metagenome]